MIKLRTHTPAKRYALAALIGLSAGFVFEEASAELVNAPIYDANAVVAAQALVPQDAPTQSTPDGALAPAAPINQGTTPPISEPFANPQLTDPLESQPPTGLTPPLSAPSAGLRTAGLGLSASLGTTSGSFSTAPTMMGDLFGGGVSIVGKPQTISTSAFLPGTIISGSGPTAVLAFDFGGGTPNDLFTASGTGVDVSGDLLFDQFQLLEPVPPTDAPTSPGPGFVYTGGVANYTGTATGGTQPIDGAFINNDIWHVQYDYLSSGIGSNPNGILIAGPDVATRRVKLSENFSPEVRDRCFFNYNFFNDAFGGIGDVSRYVLGLERVLVDDLVSLEVRIPMAGTLSSRQQVNTPGDRDFELGNTTLIGKAVLLRTDRFTLTGGTGITIPLADNARLLDGSNELLRIENEAVHMLPFLGLLHRFDRKTFFQAYTQADVDVQGNPVLANITGGPLQTIGRFNDSTLIHADISAHRVVYENRRSSSMLKGVIANAELHYTATVQGSDSVAGQGVVVENLKDNFNILNATVGAHFLVGNHFVVTPGMSVPLRDGLDEQFDYEAILQLNYLH